MTAFFYAGDELSRTIGTMTQFNRLRRLADRRLNHKMIAAIRAVGFLADARFVYIVTLTAMGA